MSVFVCCCKVVGRVLKGVDVFDFIHVVFLHFKCFWRYVNWIELIGLTCEREREKGLIVLFGNKEIICFVLDLCKNLLEI